MEKRKSSITGKLCAGIILPVVFILVLAGIFIISQVRNAIFTSSDKALTFESGAAASEADQFFMKYLSGAEGAAATMEMEAFIKSIPSGGPRMNAMESYAVLKQSLDRLAATDKETIQAIWIGDFDSSQITQSDGYNSPVGWDITSRPWYKVAETKAPILTEPYVDASTGKLIVTAAAPVFDSLSGVPIGAVGFDFKLDKLNQRIEAITVGENGFVIFCSKDQQIVHFPDSSYLQKNISESPLSANAIAAVQNAQTGLITYNLGDEQYRGYLSLVGDTGWMILSGLPNSEYSQSSNQISNLILVIFLFGILLVTAIVLLLASGIVKPLRKLAAAAQKIAAGDLDIQIECKSGDESGQVAYAMSRTVTRLRDYINYINELSSVLDQIADGNLVFHLRYDYTGEFAKLKNALLRIQSTLSITLKEIAGSADEVANGSAHISDGAQALAQGTTQQASAVEELSATLEDISGKVRTNAEDAGRANGKVREVGDSIQESNRQMRRLIDAMGEINEGSRQIGSIIKAIEDIAFQTNILALNAAVEAARAGAAGKGFAVVADEVRSLANKSQEAAKDTSVLLQNSIEAVKHGTVLANETAASLQAVVEGVQGTVETVGRISEASNEQSTAISQVFQGVGQISSVVQTNSATSEESAAASAELSNQAQKLKKSVQKFQI